MAHSTPKVIFTDRVTELTGLSARALRRRRELRQEPVSFRVGKRVAYLEEDVLQWIQKQRAEGIRRAKRDRSLDDRMNAWVQRQLDNAPPLTVEQRELLRRVLLPTSSERVG